MGKFKVQRRNAKKLKVNAIYWANIENKYKKKRRGWMMGKQGSNIRIAKKMC